MRPGRLIAAAAAAVIAATAAIYLWKVASAPDTYREVLDQRADEFQAIRETFARVADGLPPPGSSADDTCPALADLRYSSDEQKASENNAVFIMESQLRDPEVRLDYSIDFDLLIGPRRYNLVVFFHYVGPEPRFNLDAEDRKVYLDEEAEELDTALNVEFVVVSRVVDYQPMVTGELGLPVEPADVSLETFVIRAETGETVCTVRARAEEENNWQCSTISSGSSDGETADPPVEDPSLRPRESAPADLVALAGEARRSLQQELNAAGGHHIDIQHARARC